MLSIVVVHSEIAFNLFKRAHWQLPLAVIAPFKFGTIGFFLISGFLLGERVDRRNPFEYFGRRLKRVFLPWLMWLAVTSAAYALYIFAKGNFEQSTAESLRFAYHVVRRYVWVSAFWFIRTS